MTARDVDETFERTPVEPCAPPLLCDLIFADVALKRGVTAQTIYAWRQHFGTLERCSPETGSQDQLGPPALPILAAVIEEVQRLRGTASNEEWAGSRTALASSCL